MKPNTRMIPNSTSIPLHISAGIDVANSDYFNPYKEPALVVTKYNFDKLQIRFTLTALIIIIKSTAFKEANDEATETVLTITCLKRQCGRSINQINKFPANKHIWAQLAMNHP